MVHIKIKSYPQKAKKKKEKEKIIRDEEKKIIRNKDGKNTGKNR